MIILDMGSGETCRNSKDIGHAMIDQVAQSIGNRKDVILKWQLFEKAEDNGNQLLPLMPMLFKEFYDYAKEKGLMTTASVFDQQSLSVLLNYQIPFIKIANNIALYNLVGFIPRALPIYYSIGNMMFFDFEFKYFTTIDIPMACISKYPATIADYESAFPKEILSKSISDHTEGIELYEKYKPMLIEKHFKLEDSIGADSGSFAITPKELKKLINI